MTAESEPLWACVFELHEVRHVAKAEGPADEATVRQHIQQINKRMKILELRRVADVAEIDALAAEVRSDPNWVPITNMDLPAKTSAPLAELAAAGGD